MKIAFLLYEGMTALDLVGPHEVLSRMPGSESYRVGLKKGVVLTDTGLQLMADHSIEELNSADIVVVPGAGSATRLRQHPEILEWLRKMNEGTIWTASVCTGSLILEEAGILEGIKATTHWAAFDLLGKNGAIPVHERVIIDGKVITSSGVSAGIDMALTLASRVAGSEFAKAIQLGIEYDPQPPFDAGSPDKVSSIFRQLLKAKMQAGFEAD